MAELAHPPRSPGAPAGLDHQFDSYEQQRESASLGMWAFIVQEVMFFGGLFAAYMVYRAQYPDAFAAASHPSTSSSAPSTPRSSSPPR